MRSLILMMFGLLGGCATAPLRSPTSFFPLARVEGRVEDGIVRLPAFADPLPVTGTRWIGIVATQPQEYSGQTVLFRFRSDTDPNYRLLTAHRGSLVEVSARSGQGCITSSGIVFVSDEAPLFTLKPKKEPDESTAPIPQARDGSS